MTRRSRPAPRHARTAGAIAAVSLGVALTAAVAALRPRDEFAFFSKSVWRSAIACERLLNPIGGGSVVDLTPVNDSTFAALYPDDRELIIYNRNRRPTHVLRFDEAGPRGVRDAVSAAVTDSAIFIADATGAFIKRFDYAGREHGYVRMQFIPRRIRHSPHGLMATPLVAGNTPAHLLFRQVGMKFEPINAPIARYEDVSLNTLANLTSLAVFSDRTVVMHEMAVPFGYVFRHDKGAKLERFAVPLSDAVRGNVHRLPKPPLTEKNVNEFTIVAFATAPALGSGNTYYVTRIGDGKRKRFQKLLVELDSKLNLTAVYPIDANPHHMVFVNNPAAVITVDAEDNWAECRIP